jgi:selenocysteine lyase/cysteine desulfurase
MRPEVVGADEVVPLIGGRSVRYSNLDNAATTPPLRSVVETIERFLPFASSVHRGTGFKSRLSTAAYEQAREIIASFVGADAERDVVVFTKNTTEAINRMARAMDVPSDAIVLTTVLEHHSNLLPWRQRATVVHVRAESDGALDEEDFDAKLRRYGRRIALVAVTGASNVTGTMPPVHRLAEKVHAVGGRILVDAAQLAGHRHIDMRPHDDPGHLDAIAMSAHKIYAPYGSGAIVADRAMFGPHPDERGGGTVDAVTLDDVVWAALPDRVEAGSPNLVGAVAFAAAARCLQAVGFDAIADHEERLAGYASAQLAAISGVRLLGPSTGPRLGVIPFTVDGWDHRLVAAVLGFEHGVGVRSGCFCAHPYVRSLLDLDQRDVDRWVAAIASGDRRDEPGLVRISVGCYNDIADIDSAVAGLRSIVAGDVRGSYRQQDDGSYCPLADVEPEWFDPMTASARGRDATAAIGVPLTVPS